MPTLIGSPTRITAAGHKPKLIDAYIGTVNSRHELVSIAHMRSPEPDQVIQTRAAQQSTHDCAERGSPGLPRCSCRA